MFAPWIDALPGLKTYCGEVLEINGADAFVFPLPLIRVLVVPFIIIATPVLRVSDAFSELLSAGVVCGSGSGSG
ncbi:MAG: hypothetical protein Q8L60_04170, partial [Gammaproteobacteria bacterium]|nr:hypothetical protein [Gammaproteobacteria bacterium]